MFANKHFSKHFKKFSVSVNSLYLQRKWKFDFAVLFIFLFFFAFFFFLESIADDKINKLWIVSEFWCHLGSVKLNENIVIDFVTVGVEA